MSYFKNDEDRYTYFHLWNDFYAHCYDPQWDDPEYCDEMNKEEWFENWLIDEGYLVYKDNED